MDDADSGLAAMARANLVFQVNRSHLERTEEFVRAHYASETPDLDPDAEDDGAAPAVAVDVLATRASTSSRSRSLLFLRARRRRTQSAGEDVDEASAAADFVGHLLRHYDFVLRGLNRIYFLTGERAIVRGTFAPTKKSDATAATEDERRGACPSRHLFHMLRRQQMHSSTETPQPETKENKNPVSGSVSRSSTNETPRKKAGDHKDSSSPRRPLVVKVEAFPAGLQHQVVSSLTSLLDGHPTGRRTYRAPGCCRSDRPGVPTDIAMVCSAGPPLVITACHLFFL